MHITISPVIDLIKFMVVETSVLKRHQE